MRSPIIAVSHNRKLLYIIINYTILQDYTSNIYFNN